MKLLRYGFAFKKKKCAAEPGSAADVDVALGAEEADGGAGEEGGAGAADGGAGEEGGAEEADGDAGEESGVGAKGWGRRASRRLSHPNRGARAGCSGAWGQQGQRHEASLAPVQTSTSPRPSTPPAGGSSCTRTDTLMKTLVLPHPSGVSHFWNRADAVASAAALFQTAIAEAKATFGC